MATLTNAGANSDGVLVEEYIPGAEVALEAVMDPPKTPYLYFVARGDGASEFSTNLADHNRAVAKFQLGQR